MYSTTILQSNPVNFFKPKTGIRRQFWIDSKGKIISLLLTIFLLLMAERAMAQYCAAGAIETQYEKIALITFNTINNASSGTAGYEDFTAVSTSLEKGGSYVFTGTISNPYAPDEIIVWIDFNHDLDFNDAGEKVFDSPLGTGPHSGSITIPNNAPTGTTRMRVRLHETQYGPNTTPCGYSTYGQVEDYTVDIVPCSGAPNPGNTVSSVSPPVCLNTAFTLSLQNSQPSGTTYQWQSSPDNITWTNITGATGATRNVSGISTATWYRCQVTVCGPTVASTPLQMTTEPFCYCSAGATQTQFEKIALITFNTINNASSGTDGYEDFTAVSTSLEKGGSYVFTGTISNPYAPDEIIVWIDFNHDLDFNDAGEKVFDSPLGTGPHSGSITIPINAPTGTTQMRVRLHETQDGPNTTPCGYSTYGQVEDYTVDIVPCSGAPNPGNTVSSVSPPVCLNTAFTLSLQNSQPSGTTYQWQSSPDNITWTNITGATGATRNVSGISTATWYRCQVTVCGPTVASTPLQMTTEPFCYCSAGATQTQYEKIALITFNTINNASSGTAGYEDFTAVSTSLENGGSYVFTGTISNPFPTDEIIVWIDFNQDWDFNDAGEKVFDSPLGYGPHSGSITIPIDAPTGTTQMRVRLHATSIGPNFTPCGNSTVGQVEDYTVDIIPCSGAPNPGNTVSSVSPPVCPSSAFTLSLQNSQPSGTAYQWQSSPDSSTWTNISGATSATYASAGITTMTWFRCRASRCGTTTNSTALQMAVSTTPNPGNTVSSVSPPVCPSTAFTLSLQNSQPSGTTYQWQSSPNNSNWINISGATSATYASAGITTTTWFRCRASLCSTTTNSTAFQMAVSATPNPGNTVSSVSPPVCPSTAFTLSLQNSQPSGTTYQWQSSPNNSTWTNISGATSATYASAGITTTTWFRCRASLCSTTTNSTAFQMAVSATPNPGNTVSSVSPPVCPSTAFTLSLQNSQPSGTTYQWQSSPDNSTWTDISGATSATYASTGITTATWYRCQVTLCSTVSSTALQVTVSTAPNPGNTVSSVSPPVCPSTAFTLSLQNSQPSGTTFQWQSSPDSSTWTDISGATSATYASAGITTTTWFRCLASLCSITTNSTALQMTVVATTNPDPGNTISSVGPPVCPSTAFTLSLQNSQPSGTTYQWQSSPDNSTWTDISGATSATYASAGITTTTWFRCQATLCNLSTNSNALQMTVAATPNPGNTISSVNPPVCPSSAFTLSLQNSQPSGTTYQWQSSPNNSTWTDISGATGDTYASTGITTATWYRCQVTLCGTVSSTALQVTVSTAPNPGNTVSSVGLPICPSTAFTLSLQNSQPSGTTYQWQSSPNNSTWTDISGATGDTYASTGITTTTWYRCQATLCGISTNSTALQMTVSTAPNPGNTISSVAPPVCAGNESFVLSLENSQQAGSTYQWQSSPNNSTWVNISGATSATRTVSSISSTTWFRCQVTKCGVTVASTPKQMTTEGCYCTAGATNTQSQYEKISLITLNTISNASSSAAGYEDFTAVSTTLQQTASYTFTGTASNPYAQDEMIVWIDFNQDLDFNDTGEKVFDSATGTGPYTGTITIPSNATLGTTRMRVRLHDTSTGPNTTPCGTSTYGQVEDYSVSIEIFTVNRTWVGGSGTWNVASNWSPAIVPTSANSVIINTGAPTIPATYSAVSKEITISSSADLIVASGATLTVQSTTTHGISVQGSGSSLQNTGTITITGSGSGTHGIFVTSGATLTNQGTIEVPYTANIGLAGIYNNAGTINNQPNGIISIDRSGGTFAGLATIAGGTFTNQGVVNIGMNPNAALAAKGINILGTNTTATNAASGIINVYRCGTNWLGLGVESNATIINNGTIKIGVNSSIVGDGISATSTFQNNGTITIANVSDKLIEGNGIEYFHNNINGIVQGTGTILAAAFDNNGGTLKPGYSPGLMTFNAGENFSNSIMDIEVNGPGTAGVDYDQIITNGTATLGGSSTLNLSINFTPSGNQQLVILHVTALSGTFATINGLTSGWSIMYNTPNTGDVSLNFALLPIELMYFKGKADGPANQLEWATASEENSQYHAVERSADGINNWQEIGRRDAAGSSNEQHTYHFLDDQPLPIGYYRLMAVDFDGQYEYSNLVVIERETKGTDITSLFPNPTSGALNLRVAASEPVPILISVFDATGCLVQQVQTAEAKKGINDYSVNVAQLPAGLYFVKITNEEASSVRHFIKQ